MPDTRTRDETENHGRLRDGLSSARDTASDAARRTAQSLEANPFGILVGGLALGAVAGALLPRSQREKEMLAPIGATLGERLRSATSAAREAGRSQLDELGINGDAARGQVQNLVDGLLQAARSAGTAAAQSATGNGQAGGNTAG